MLGAWALGALLLLAPAVAHAQLFIASKPDPSFMIGPLFVRASVTPDLKPVVVEILWSIAVPPGKTAVDLEQNLNLLWPGGLIADPTAGPPDPALERFITQRGFSVIESGRLPLAAQHLYRLETDQPPARIPGGAPFVTFVRDSGPLGLTPPATWIRVPWTPLMANRAYLMSLPLTTRGLIKPKPATWAERTFWGPRHRISLSFHEVRQRAVFPLYLEHRDRVVRLAEDPAQLLIDFADTDHLKIDELFPQSAKRQISETLESTESVSMFLDAEGLSPQTLTVQFGYFTRLQSWAPILIPMLFFVLGNGAGVLVRTVTERISKRLAGRVKFGRPRETSQVRQHGVVLDEDTLRRIRPGATTYDEVLELCGRDVEERSRVTDPDHRSLVYRGRRVVPRRRQVLGWLATVRHWDVEEHEVEIELERDVVRDVQARVRRSRLASPEPA
jgi:hypothetical protein